MASTEPDRPVLDHTSESSRPGIRPWVSGGMCLIWVLVMTPVSLGLGLFGLMSVSGGHGDYGLPRAIFPYTMLLSRAAGEITAPLMVLAVAQVPLYGVLVFLTSLRGRRRLLIVTAAIAGLHLAAAVACFSLPW